VKGRLPSARASKSITIIMVALAGAMSLAAASARAFEEPDGFGKAKFGMHPADVKAVYPNLTLISAPVPTPGEQQLPFTLAFYDQTEDQAVGPLRKCHVQFRFFQDELYEIQFRCPDKSEVTKYLIERFGDPNQTDQSTLMWLGARASVTHVRGAGTFAFADLARTRAETMTLLGYLGHFPASTPASAPKVTGQGAGSLKSPGAAVTTDKTVGGVRQADTTLLDHLTLLAYADPDSGSVPLEVHFRVELFEGDNPVNPKFSWDFDEGGATSHRQTPVHIFRKPGKYEVRLKVTDARNRRGSDTVVVDVGPVAP
jgi:hypothetical protein